LTTTAAGTILFSGRARRDLCEVRRFHSTRPRKRFGAAGVLADGQQIATRSPPFSDIRRPAINNGAGTSTGVGPSRRADQHRAKTIRSPEM